MNEIDEQRCGQHSSTSDYSACFTRSVRVQAGAPESVPLRSQDALICYKSSLLFGGETKGGGAGSSKQVTPCALSLP